MMSFSHGFKMWESIQVDNLSKENHVRSRARVVGKRVSAFALQQEGHQFHSRHILYYWSGLFVWSLHDPFASVWVAVQSECECLVVSACGPVRDAFNLWGAAQFVDLWYSWVTAAPSLLSDF